MRKFKTHGLRMLIHVAALLPLSIIIWDFTQGQLTANPIQEITLRTGKITLVLLVTTLACTPINIVFGIRQVLPLRRTLGLYTFTYASLHFMTFVGLDYWFDLSLIWADIGEKRFALVGFAAFLTLLPLAITSTVGWIKRLGQKWIRLHWLIYLSALLAVTHFTWQVKADLLEPFLYGSVVALFLIVRLPPVRNSIGKFRSQLTKGQT